MKKNIPLEDKKQVLALLIQKENELNKELAKTIRTKTELEVTIHMLKQQIAITQAKIEDKK